MKTLLKTLSVLAICMFPFASCEVEPIVEEQTEGGEYLYYFNVSSADEDTKTAIDGTTVKWEVNDKLGFFANGTTNSYGTIAQLEPKVQVPVYLQTALSENGKVYAYFPYVENVESASAIPFTIPANQTGDMDANPLISLPYSVPAEMSQGRSNVADIKFCNLGSIIQFKVYSSVEAYRSETIESIQFTSSSDIAGDFTLDATKVNYDNKSTLAAGDISNGKKVITLTSHPAIGTSSTDAGVAYMVLLPGSYSGTVTVNTNQARYEYQISTAKNFNRSSIKPLSIDLGKEGARNAIIKYNLVEEDQTDWRGNYLIAFSSSTFMDGSLAGGASGVGAQSTAVGPGSALSGKSITSTWGDEYYLTIEAIDDNNLSAGYLLKTHSETTPYCYRTTNSNGMDCTDNVETASKYPVIITFTSSSDISLACGKAVLHFNNQTIGSGGQMFRFYKDGGQSKVYLYKRTETISVEGKPRIRLASKTGTIGIKDNVATLNKNVSVALENPSSETDVVTVSIPSEIDWLTAEISGGMLRMVAQAPVYESRTAILTLSAPNASSVQYTLTQEAAGVANPTVSAVLNDDKDGFVATWNAVDHASGYSCYYSTTSDATTGTTLSPTFSDGVYSVSTSESLDAGTYYLFVKSNATSPYVASSSYAVTTITVGSSTDYSTVYSSGEGLLTTSGGTSASTCSVIIGGTSYSGVKAGTTSKSGAVQITVPAGTTKLHIHAVAWNGEGGNVTITPGSKVVGDNSITLTADTGISGNSPFTLSGSGSGYYFVINLSGISEDTTLTLTKASKRFVLFGVNAE